MEPTLPIPNRVLKRCRADDTNYVGKVGNRQIKASEILIALIPTMKVVAFGV